MDVRKFTSLFTALFIGLNLSAQSQEQWGSSRIQHEIEKLPVNGTALYIAAHPDDENTRLISWLANEKKYRTAYLSLTRGDGGQNLIGNELGVKLGIIRTHELMAARSIDGGEQFFTRAFDFGYSKSPEETFTKWNRDSVLSDMVFVIRMIQPDVIVTRFPPDGYHTHGHHTASAILALEAYEAAADPQRFPEQFAYGVKPWSVKAIFYNASTWWNKELPQLAENNDSFYKVDVGGFNPLLGASYTEIAGRSRSMHKSQGFGSAQPAGQQWEYLKLLKSRSKIQSRDPFSELTSSISDKSFLSTFNNISYSAEKQAFKECMTKLVMLYKWFNSHADTPLFAHRRNQVKEIIKQSLGLKMELSAENLKFGQGATLPVKFSILERLGELVQIDQISPNEGIQSIQNYTANKETLKTGINSDLEFEITLDKSYITELPWVHNGLSGSMFANSWRDGGIYPGTNRSVKASIKLIINGTPLEYTVPLTYKSVDPVKGERNFPVIVEPQLEINLPSENLLFINSEKEVLRTTISNHAPFNGQIYTQLSGPYSATKGPKEGYHLTNDTTLHLDLNVSLLAKTGLGWMTFKSGGTLKKVSMIEYDHIGILQHCEDPKINLSAINIQQNNRKIAYLQGAGDEVADYLRLAGYQVTDIQQEQLTRDDLAKFDVLVLGIRSYNTLYLTDDQQGAIQNFARDGGHVVVQYLTSRGLHRDNFAPLPLKLGRGRVTEEDAPMVFINPKEPLLLLPNQITSSDFEGWVQERGLYFGDEWDMMYRPVFRSHDQGETDLEGALLIADFGNGSFIYTGISFFRQLPAGVPGAYRLLGNIIDYQNPSSNGK